LDKKVPLKFGSNPNQIRNQMRIRTSLGGGLGVLLLVKWGF